MSEEINRSELIEKINEYLISLPDDKSREDFLDEIDVCFLCGSTILPCYCAPIYDE